MAHETIECDLQNKSEEFINVYKRANPGGRAKVLCALFVGEAHFPLMLGGSRHVEFVEQSGCALTRKRASIAKLRAQWVTALEGPGPDAAGMVQERTVSELGHELEALRRRYLELAKANHPDMLGGDATAAPSIATQGSGGPRTRPE